MAARSPQMLVHVTTDAPLFRRVFYGYPHSRGLPMDRSDVLERLARYVPLDERDDAQRRTIEAFVRQYAECFHRSLAIGHLTGSAWLLDTTGGRVLLTHHRKLDRWIQLGGHADGDPDLLGVALREAREE